MVKHLERRILFFVLLANALLFILPNPILKISEAHSQTDYLAYCGWEDPSRGVNSPWEEGWIESDCWLRGDSYASYSTTYSRLGTYSLKLEKYGDGSGDHRGNFGGGDPYKPLSSVETYVSIWVYIDLIYSVPGGANWGGLLSSVRSYSGDNWYTGLQLLGTPPYDLGWDVRHAHTPGDADPAWRYVIHDTYTTTLVSSSGSVVINNMGVPYQRWFRLEWYLKRDASDGIYKVWIDGDPLFSLEGDTTWHSMDEPADRTQVAYQYGMASRIYLDELYIYTYNAHNTTPQPSPDLPNAGIPHVNTTAAGFAADVSGIASVDTTHMPTSYLSQWVVEHNSTGLAQNATGSFSANPINPPAIILSFDDNDVSLVESALPIMNDYGYDGLSFINCTKSQAQYVAQNLADAGWEIGSHTMTHRDLTSGLTTAQLSYQVNQSKVWLEENIIGANPVISFAYPYGADNLTVQNFARANYLLGRDAGSIYTGTIWNGQQNYNIDPYIIRNDNYASKIAEVFSELNEANKTGYAVLLFHDVKSSPTKWGITPTNFNYVLSQINQSGYPVGTFKDAYLRTQTAAWSFTITLNNTAGKTVYFKAWVKDTLGSWSDASIKYITTTGSSKPYISTTVAGELAYVTAIASVDKTYAQTVYLSQWVVEHNNTGVAQNVTGYFSANPVNQPAIILTFDDNDVSWIDNALPLMDNYGFVGVGFINCTKNQAQYVAQNLADAGWEIGSHTMTHPFLTSELTASQLSYQINQSKAWLEENIIGAYPVISFAYPFGANNSTIVSYVKSHYLLGRDADTIYTGEIWDGKENYSIDPYIIRNDNYASKIAEVLSELGSSTGYAVILIHDVKYPSSKWGITPTNLDYVLSQINQSGYPVGTFKDAYLRTQTAAWSFTITLNNTAGKTVYFKAWVKDTSGNWSQPSSKCITIINDYPSAPPEVGNLTLNTTNAGATIRIAGSATDDLALSGYIVGTNNTGVWVNQSWTAFSGNPKNANFSWTTNLNSTVGVVVKFQVWVNDTDNQWFSDDLYLAATDSNLA